MTQTARAPRSLLLVAALAMPQLAPAPSPATVDRPSEQRPALPAYEELESGAERERILPRVAPPPDSATSGLAAGRRFTVRSYRFTGATLLDPEDLDRIAAPYRDREVGYAELEALRSAVTDAYVERGYISSGAVVPDQVVADGIVEIRVIEGRLEEVEVETDGRLRTGPIRRRLERASRGAVNLFHLEEALQILQQERMVSRVDAELLPGSELGASRLRVRLSEATPWEGHLGVANDENPTIGEYKGVARAAHANVLGFADEGAVLFGRSEGFWELDGRYMLPLNAVGSRVGGGARHSESEIIEPSFADLEIETRATTFGVTLGQGLRRTLRSNLDAYVTAELRSAKTTLLGEGITLGAEGPDRGRSRVTALRLGTDFTWRGSQRVLAARSLLSAGIDALGATQNRGSTPDGEFFTWLGQVQVAQRLPVLSAQVIARADVQLAASRLLGLEQFAVGGISTVRGYRENEVVRDNGLVLSAESRVPVYVRGDGWLALQVAPFVDWGTAWNHPSESRRSETLWSLGVGAIANIGSRGLLQCYWAHAFEDVSRELDRSPQDDGFHCRGALRFP